MNNINFRSAQLTDLPVLYTFEQGIITAERPFDPTLKEGNINYYDIKEMVEAEDVEVVVATVNDNIVASAYVKNVNAKDYLRFKQYGYVGFMFVRPEYRGKGIAQMIIGKLKTWAKSRGLDELRLDVYDDNHRAVSAYEKVGFKKHMVEMRVEIS